MSVNNIEKKDRSEIRHSSALKSLHNIVQRKPMPKQPTARLKIINGRPFYYEVTNIWDPIKQRCYQKSRYLGKELPKGYRLIK